MKRGKLKETVGGDSPWVGRGQGKTNGEEAWGGGAGRAPEVRKFPAGATHHLAFWLPFALVISVDLGRAFVLFSCVVLQLLAWCRAHSAQCWLDANRLRAKAPQHAPSRCVRNNG